ncbi:NADH dehydrogenase [ubiquinone] 1 subunit C1, mitochondrial [Fukomys damarensis]|uniref:NADH dehydrogenase [ubiquinone] 1 subunit C1, mitochondrial n=1 Tax=Fukomys damarensis TaxID=885580 RepID=A0A091E4T1_FUKDA|nr:NADH dehydrogenase [ubiquinone] 1 subunit C1, mitochondrial [Fukomys damarensis]
MIRAATGPCSDKDTFVVAAPPSSSLASPVPSTRQASARSKFYVRDPPDDNKANWLKVGLTLGTTVFLWFYVSVCCEPAGGEMVAVAVTVVP